MKKRKQNKEEKGEEFETSFPSQVKTGGEHDVTLDLRDAW